MGFNSIWHWLIVLLIVVILFGGGGKLSRLMGDFGKGLKSFKKGLKDEGGEAAEEDGDAKALKSEDAAKAQAAQAPQSGQPVGDQPTRG
jgi:sec-independent protein translocase protein TatA